MNTGVYQISNTVNDKIYVGSAAKGFIRRWTQHKSDLLKGKHKNTILQNFYNKYGSGSLIFSVLQYCPPDICVKKEQWFMDVLKPEINILPVAGSPLGVKRSKETIEKTRQQKLGVKLSEEHKKKIGDALRGREGKKGYKFSSETIDRWKKERTGKKRTGIALENIRSSHKTWVHQSMLGKNHSEESKQKSRESHCRGVYVIKTPKGDLVETKSLRHFALSNELNPSALIYTFTRAEGNKYKAHKGYKVISIEQVK